MSALINISGLNKSYQKQQVLKDVALSVYPGQILGLVGPNGAGKTTCLQALLGLTDFDGNIEVCGFNPNKQRVEMLNEVAYISDVAVLPKWLKVNQAHGEWQHDSQDRKRQQSEWQAGKPWSQGFGQ